jgi:hypothetical protein
MAPVAGLTTEYLSYTLVKFEFLERLISQSGYVKMANYTIEAMNVKCKQNMKRALEVRDVCSPR